VAVGDKDVAVRGGDYIGGRIEQIRCVAGLTWFTERQQDLALRRKLDDGVTFAVAGAPIGHPYIAGAIDIEAVRPVDHAAAETRHHIAAGVQFQHRIDA